MYSNKASRALVDQPKAHAVYIGVELVDSFHYGSKISKLPSCINDANAMKKLATDFEAVSDSFNYEGLLGNDEATIPRLTEIVESEAKILESGDYFMLTFSGHGMSVDIDGEIQTAWCMFDFPLFDVHLNSLLSTFKPGVRVLVVSDSCSSAGIVEPLSLSLSLERFVFSDDGTRRLGLGPVKRLESGKTDELLDEHLAAYRAIISKHRGKELSAAVVHAFACKEGETTNAGPTIDDLSVFTANILDVWSRACSSSPCTFDQFDSELKSNASGYATPGVTARDPKDEDFLGIGPFRPI